jgi:hypothetical protein
MMALIDDVKVHLMLTTNARDVEVQDLINAAEADLKLIGVPDALAVATDPLIKRYIVTYCKQYFGYENPDHDLLDRARNMMMIKFGLAAEYAETGEEGV